mmetsp:Transcript_72935/g.170887  ORF Transcript_72935/g.170887 Transcript_72935/m.170887 type:complete len:267 (+) Transcript_72935:40-840(+)
MATWSLGQGLPGSSPCFNQGRGGQISTPVSTGPSHLESIGRRWELHPEEHRNLPPVGAPAPAPAASATSAAPAAFASPPPSASGVSPPGSFSSQASAVPLLQAQQGPGAHARISVPNLLEGGRLGLIIQNCWVSSISNPAAAQWGWQVGDHILAVNGHAVSTMQQLSEEIRRAVTSHQALSHPVVFDVWRPAADALAGPSALPSAERRTRWECCGDPCSGPDYAVAPQLAPPPQSQLAPPPGYGGYGYGASAQAPRLGAQRRRALC